MKIFLEAVAAYVNEKFGSEVQDICLVFPNRRASLFFNRYVAGLNKVPVWAFPARTIADLMKELSEFELADSITLVVYLYKIYLKSVQSQEQFDNFFGWGEMLLNDFDDIDKNLVDAKQLFQNLADLKEIEQHFSLPEDKLKIIRDFWSNIHLRDEQTLTKDFVQIWEKLFLLYSDFKEVLKGKGIAYEGMMYREVSDRIDCEKIDNFPYSHYIFIGFNAINECERKLFRYLKALNKATFFWDYDTYYIHNEWHEAGRFIRENLKQFPAPDIDLPFHFLTEPKDISVISVPSDVGQAKMIGHVLSENNLKEEDLNSTAIVLADENMLIPVITSLPAQVKSVNVSLGYPMRLTSVYSFVESVINLQQSVRKRGSDNVLFYHRDVILILNHPYVQGVSGLEAQNLGIYIIQSNRIFLRPEELGKSEFLKKVFCYCSTYNEFLNYLKDLGTYSVNTLSQKKGAIHDFEQEYWFSMLTVLNRLSDLLRNEFVKIEMFTFIRILRKLTSGLSVPFRGEPLSGLQVLGMLETRCLDFKNVILLSANEGTLPKNEASLSFIPYNLRNGFGLPTIEHQDAIYAYYFYRLIQRAEHVTLMYNSKSGNRSGEISRFLYQLKYEPAFNVKEQEIGFKVSLSKELDINIQKNEDVLSKLMAYSLPDKNNYLTPTALTNYQDCSLRFYFQYIAKLKEKEEVVEDIEGAMFGRLLHASMEFLYVNYLEKEILRNEFDKLLKMDAFLEDCILKAFAREYFKRENEIPQLHGKSIVVREVLLKYIRRILEVDREIAPVRLISFENTFKNVIPVVSGSNTIRVRIGGKIDRVDQTQEGIRVVDYKTGKVVFGFSSLGELFEFEGNKHNKEVFQILLYSYLLGEDNRFGEIPVVPGIYGLRSIFESDFDSHIKLSKTDVRNFSLIRDDFLLGLQRLVGEIFHPDVPFHKTEDIKKCIYCPYKQICHR